MIIHAQAIRLPEEDNISTDLIIAGKYTKTLNYCELASHLFEDIGKEVAATVKGKILLAGKGSEKRFLFFRAMM